MPASVSKRENNIISSVWDEPLKSDELSECFENLNHHMDEGEGVTHLLFDIRNAGNIPAQAPFLFIRSQIIKHGKLGRIATIGTNPVAKVLAQMAVKMASNKIHFFDTEEQALEYLKE